MLRRKTWSGAARFIMIVLMLGLATMATAQKKKDISKMTPAEKQAHLNELKKQQLELQRKKGQQAEANRPKDLTEIIERYENLLKRCDAGQKSDRCAESMYMLGGLYYDQARDEFGAASERHAKAMEEWDRRGGRGDPPKSPIPDYNKSLQMYWRLTREYPAYPKLPEAFFQMANNYLLAGHLDTTRIIFEQLVNRFPNSPRVSGAQFRLGELAFMDNNFNKAYEHFKKVKKDQVDIITWEMNHYRLGECAYNVGDFDKAVEYFHTYVVECDANRYLKKEFREMALEYMAISFSDMPDGVQEAIKFFKKNKGKPYEAQVIYMVGQKNRDHGQWDQAIAALTGALKTYPMYKDAPLARQSLIECYVVKKDHERANKEREALVDDYGEGSKWYQANSKERAVIDRSKISVRRALGDIAIYYHGLAQRQKKKELYDIAMKRYEEFFRKFPEDKWRVYEYKYNVAEIYSSMGNCDKAADYYNFVAMEDLSTYPAFVQDIDTLGMDSEQLEQLKASRGDKTSPVAISQEDAGYNTIAALDACRKKEMAKEGLDEAKAYTLPSTKKLIDHCLNFHRRFPQSPNAVEVLYLAGSLYFSGKQYNEAIPLLKKAADDYPDAKIANNVLRLLANAYSLNNQTTEAMTTYEALIKRTPSDSKEYAEVMELAAGALYRKAEATKKAGNHAAAAEEFKSISQKYGRTKVAAIAWFEAGVCYEEMKDLDRAAKTFLELTEKFPQAAQREAAFIRAAENYKNNNKYSEAAQVYLTAANQIVKAEFAIPSLSSASEMYQKMDDFVMAGKMFALIFERYRDDPKTPMALYNAGIIFEKGKHYESAIEVYQQLAENYKDSEYAAEAYFSIGLCYEKLKEFAKMAHAFADYAEKYTGDKFKQVQALVKAGNAFYNMENFRDSEKNYSTAIAVHEKFGKTADIDVANIAEAHYRVGEIHLKKFEDIKLTTTKRGKEGEREIKKLIENKTKAILKPAEHFGKAIEMGVEEWTMRATYMIGRIFYDMGAAVADQTLFGNKDEMMAGRIIVQRSLGPYYERAMQYFGQNITWAKEQNISGEYIDMSMQALMEMAYKRANVWEIVANEFKNIPMPAGLDQDEQEAFGLEIEMAVQENIERALPLYEEGMQMAINLGIANSEWTDKIRERLRELTSGESELINVQIVQWVPKERPKQYDADGNEIVPRGKDPEFDRSMRRIQNIVNNNISVNDKIDQLRRIQMEAERNIKFEEERISELKRAKSGS